MISFILLKKSNLYNYSDDNTLSYSHPDLLETKNVLTSESEYVIEWFGTNQMQANPGKFQAIVLGKRGHGDCESFTIHDNTVKCEDSVKLLGVPLITCLILTCIFLISVKKQQGR